MKSAECVSPLNLRSASNHEVCRMRISMKCHARASVCVCARATACAHACVDLLRAQRFMKPWTLYLVFWMTYVVNMTHA